MQEVLNTYGDIRLGFGQSDEYSFVIHKDSNLYGEATISRARATSRDAILLFLRVWDLTGIRWIEQHMGIKSRSASCSKCLLKQ